MAPVRMNLEFVEDLSARAQELEVPMVIAWAEPADYHVEIKTSVIPPQYTVNNPETGEDMSMKEMLLAGIENALDEAGIE